MPSREFHKIISKILFGETGDKVHKYMDEPYKWLGNKHRSQRHDTLTIALLQMTQGNQAGLHAAAHIITDKTMSAAFNKMNKMFKDFIKKGFGL